MKFFPALLTFLLLTSAGFAQQKDIEVFEKKDGNKSIVVARNTGKVPYIVTLTIDAKGMDVTPSMKVEALIPAGYMKEMATLQPRPGESWSYGYEVAYIESIDKNPKSPTTSQPQAETKINSTPTTTTTAAPKVNLSNAAIIVYTQAGCGRCTFVKKEMTSKGIAYEEVDVNSGSPDAADMWIKLREGGFTGTSVTMPVVKVNGQLHYNIKDLNGFVEKLKS